MGHTRVQVWTFLTTYVLLYHPLFFLRINPHFDSFKHWKHVLAPMSPVVDITRDVLTKSDASLSKKEFTQAPWALRENLTMLHTLPSQFDLRQFVTDSFYFWYLPRTNTQIRCALLFKLPRTFVQLCRKYFLNGSRKIVPDHLYVLVLRDAEERLTLRRLSSNPQRDGVSLVTESIQVGQPGTCRLTVSLR